MALRGFLLMMHIPYFFALGVGYATFIRCVMLKK
jgi:hypothetical protein